MGNVNFYGHGGFSNFRVYLFLIGASRRVVVEAFPGKLEFRQGHRCFYPPPEPIALNADKTCFSISIISTIPAPGDKHFQILSGFNVTRQGYEASNNSILVLTLLFRILRRRNAPLTYGVSAAANLWGRRLAEWRFWTGRGERCAPAI